MAKTAAELVAEARAQIENIPPQDAFEEVGAGGVVVLDVREQVEWEHHIAGAVQIPRGVLEAMADPSSPRHNPALDPTGRVIVYCRSGARSALATLTLKTMGYEKAANLDGGFAAWADAGLPTEEHHAGL